MNRILYFIRIFPILHSILTKCKSEVGWISNVIFHFFKVSPLIVYNYNSTLKQWESQFFSEPRCGRMLLDMKAAAAWCFACQNSWQVVRHLVSCSCEHKTMLFKKSSHLLHFVTPYPTYRQQFSDVNSNVVIKNINIFQSVRCNFNKETGNKTQNRHIKLLYCLNDPWLSPNSFTYSVSLYNI